MTQKLAQESIPRSQTYGKILIENIWKLVTLKAGDDAKKRLAGVLPFQTLHIVDRPIEGIEPTEIVNYGPSNNSSKPIKNKTNAQQSHQNQVKLLKREPDVNQSKENNSDVKCMLCNDPHATHQCPLIRQLRDGNIKAPPNFCWSHFDRIYDLCHKKE